MEIWNNMRQIKGQFWDYDIIDSLVCMLIPMFHAISRNFQILYSLSNFQSDFNQSVKDIV